MQRKKGEVVKYFRIIVEVRVKKILFQYPKNNPSHVVKDL